MKSKNKRIVTALTAFVMTFSMGAGAGAETLLDIAQNNVPLESSSAIYSYDPENDTYELTDSKGNVIDLGGDEDETDIPEEENSGDIQTTIKLNNGSSASVKVAAVTTVPAGQSKTTVTTTTVPKVWYVGRRRSVARSEVAAITVVKPLTTVKKTTTTVKKTTTTTTTKKTTTTTTKARYNGIDVARFQGDIDWTKVKKAGIDFVMIRAGYGRCADQVDANFKVNIAGAQKAGIDCGVYWYSYALTTADALKEAKTCYNTIKGYKLSYPVAFDIEESSQMSLSTTLVSNITKVFCDYLEDQKYYVSVYSFASMLKDKMNSSVLTSYDIWVAHINVSKPNYSGNYGIWQYSHTGRVSGIDTVVDLDYSYKYYPAIMKKNKLNGYT